MKLSSWERKPFPVRAAWKNCRNKKWRGRMIVKFHDVMYRRWALKTVGQLYFYGLPRWRHRKEVAKYYKSDRLGRKPDRFKPHPWGKKYSPMRQMFVSIMKDK